MALGAASGQNPGNGYARVVWILGFGLGIGIPAALASTRLVENRLFGVQGKDATVVACATLLLLITASSAAYWPARRASRVDPLDALRVNDGRRLGSMVGCWSLWAPVAGIPVGKLDRQPT